MLAANERDFCNHLANTLEYALRVVSEARDDFRGDRTAVSWVSDMLCLTQIITNKNEPPRDLEYMFFKLIAFCPALYGNFDSLNQSYRQMCALYDSLLAARDRFVNTCHTLIKVEQQQFAKERANRGEDGLIKIKEGEISPFYTRFWTRPLEEDHSFFKDISSCAMQFEEDISNFLSKKRKSSDNSEEDWCIKLKGIFGRITYYPVSSMLMPVLLTKYIADDMDHESVYAYMKFRESSFPRNRLVGEFKENIQLLYNAIEKRIDELNDEWVDPVDEWYMSEVQKNMQEAQDTAIVYNSGEEIAQLSAKKRAKASSQISGTNLFRVIDAKYHEYKRTAINRGLPIISLPDILDVLEEKFQDNGYPYNKNQLWRLLVEYTAKNGLNYEDSKTSFIDDKGIIISVALLYNAESYLNYKFETVSNKDVRAALDYLNDKHIIESRTSESNSNADKYLSMYKEFCVIFPISEEDLSPLALCKYFKLDSWPSLEQIDFFETLHFRVTKILAAAKAGIFSVFCSTSEEVYSPTIVSIEAYEKLLELFGIMKKGLLTNKKDAVVNGGDSNGYINELEEFVVHPNNFTYWGFQKFIKSKEESDEDLWKGFHLPIQYREEIVCELFEFTIDLIISMLHDQVRQYCVKQLEWYSHEDVCKNFIASTTPKSNRGDSQ